MQRFLDQPLRSAPHLAVLGSNKVGNFVVTVPLLRGLKAKYPDAVLDFFGSSVTHSLETHCPYIDFCFPIHTSSGIELSQLGTAIQERRQAAGSYDLVINCDGFNRLNVQVMDQLAATYGVGVGNFVDSCAQILPIDRRQQILQDSDWNHPAFLQRYQPWLTSNYIAEIFCYLAYVETNFFRLELPERSPPFPVPDVLVHLTATRRAKLWPIAAWLRVVQWCETQGLTVGLIGSAPDLQRRYYQAGTIEEILLAETQTIDLRGRTSLLELAGALRQTKVCLSIDSGPLHIAAAVGCPTIALFGNDKNGEGASPFHLWVPRLPHVYVVPSTYTCILCQEQRFQNDACLITGHPCMTHLAAEAVIAQLQALLSSRKKLTV